MQRSITTAPMDGRKVTVFWTDAVGQENESIAQFRSLDRLRAIGGEWDESDAGWWAFVDGSTQKKINPHSWVASGEEE